MIKSQFTKWLFALLFLIFVPNHAFVVPGPISIFQDVVDFSKSISSTIIGNLLPSAGDLASMALKKMANNGSLCARDLLTIVSSSKEHWAKLCKLSLSSKTFSRPLGSTFGVKNYCQIHLFIDADSQFKRPSGVMSGNRLWLGDFDQCLKISTVVVDENITISPHYCRLVLLNSTWPISSSNVGLGAPLVGLILGTCLPESCTMQNMKDVLNPLCKLTISILDLLQIQRFFLNSTHQSNEDIGW